MIKAVIDTNVLVSAFWTRNPHSPTVRIASAILHNVFTPLYSADIIAEYREVLMRSHFCFDVEDVNALIECIVKNGELVVPAPSDADFPDPSDKVFFCTTMSKRADESLLVTGNAKHYPPVDFIVSPAEFCQILGI